MLGKILLVDRDNKRRGKLSVMLARKQYLVHLIKTGMAAFERASAENYDIIFIMPGTDDLESLVELRCAVPNTRVIAINSVSNGKSTEIINRGLSDFKIRPFTLDEIVDYTDRLMEQRRFEQKISKLNFDRVCVAISSPIRRSILKLLYKSSSIRFIDMLREIGMADEHQKVVFHIRNLKRAALITQDEIRNYVITNEGTLAVKSIELFEKSFAGFSIEE
ncbi:MAG: hypothetical protein H7844_04615 [Nitrospirae bacterium YQR-1]